MTQIIFHLVELLHMFSNILSSPQRLLADKTNVCIAIWALCANNHKVKNDFQL